MNYLTVIETEAIGRKDHADDAWVRHVEGMVLRNEWEPGEDADVDGTVRVIFLHLLETRKPAE